MSRFLILLAGIVLVTGCKQQMRETPRFEPYEVNPFYRDSLAMRHPVEGTVARGEAALTARYETGTNPYYGDETVFVGAQALPQAYLTNLTDGFPFEVDRSVLERGQERFNIYCAPCHGRLGNGEGMIVQRGLRPPPTFHSDRLRQAPAGHFYNVITNGYGAMYSYAARVSEADRWAITAYIRALQLSQHATLDEVPTDRRQELAEGAP